ncbi:MAG: hypothetical protein PHQ12_10260 [Chthoniobacteraceae bacterium]|nr:hypothetical protein [Chthoniobacteraceae bacterium]
MNALPPSARPRGFALIITLFFIVLLCVIVVGFLNSSRVERVAAASHLDRESATHFASEGIERTVATLQQQTVDPAQMAGESDADYLARKRHWISQPGALIVPNDPPADQKQLQKRIDLSSGIPAAASYSDPVLQPPNLNLNHLITERTDEMKLKWVYVRKDADFPPYSYDFDEEPKFDAKKPIIGRFAYWVDDESSKINYNLAWKRGGSNTNPVSHPSCINLTALKRAADGSALSETMADAMHNWTTGTPGRYFNTFADARQLDATTSGITRFLSDNKFELTHFNHDPDTTFFGEDRIMLTTNRDLVPTVKNPDGTVAHNPDGSIKYARRFLDILRDDNYQTRDPGIVGDIAGGQEDWQKDLSGNTLLPNKFDAVMQMLIGYLSKTNWPLVSGSTTSFASKYYSGAPATDPQIGQFAANIIDYVRAKESAQPMIPPLRFAKGRPTEKGDNKNKYTLYSAPLTAAGSYQGVCRAPYITEFAVSESGTASAISVSGTNMQGWEMYFQAELFLPQNYGLDSIDLVPDTGANPAASSTGWFISFTTLSPGSGYGTFYFPTGGNSCIPFPAGVNTIRIFKDDIIAGGDGPNHSVLKAGSYVVVRKRVYRDRAFKASADQKNPWSGGFATRVGITLGQGDPAQPLFVGKGWPSACLVQQTASGVIHCELEDPGTGPLKPPGASMEIDDPRCGVASSDWVKVASNTFGSQNSRWTVGKSPGSFSPQQDTDENGLVSDASLYMPPPKGVGANGPTGDNGRVTSIGELGYVCTGVNAGAGSVPWRTIRLQPNKYPDATTLPDWALLELFTVPNTDAGASDALYKPHDTSVGGRVNVNSHVAGFENMTRDRGLAALLTGAPHLNGADPETVATNIYQHLLATGANAGKVYGYPWKPAPASTEPNIYDTPGEICEINGVADGGEKSEALVRDIVSLTTARGEVFSIYTVGQTLKQTPTGKLVVTAEQRQQAMVERYVDKTGTATDDNGLVRFRTIYFQNLAPY